MIDPQLRKDRVQHDYLTRQTTNPTGNFAVIQSYDPITNMATIMLSAPDSDLPGDLITNVPCPVQLGVQSVAPEPGRPCWVAFRAGQNDRKAVIVNYFNHQFDKYDYTKQYRARSSVANYTLGI